MNELGIHPLDLVQELENEERDFSFTPGEQKYQAPTNMSEAFQPIVVQTQKSIQPSSSNVQPATVQPKNNYDPWNHEEQYWNPDPMIINEPGMNVQDDVYPAMQQLAQQIATGVYQGPMPNFQSQNARIVWSSLLNTARAVAQSDQQAALQEAAAEEQQQVQQYQDALKYQEEQQGVGDFQIQHSGYDWNDIHLLTTYGPEALQQQIDDYRGSIANLMIQQSGDGALGPKIQQMVDNLTPNQILTLGPLADISHTIMKAQLTQDQQINTQETFNRIHQVEQMSPNVTKFLTNDGNLAFYDASSQLTYVAIKLAGNSPFQQQMDLGKEEHQIENYWNESGINQYMDKYNNTLIDQTQWVILGNEGQVIPNPDNLGPGWSPTDEAPTSDKKIDQGSFITNQLSAIHDSQHWVPGYYIPPPEKHQSFWDQVGRWAVGEVGNLLGGAVGTLIMPGVGTVAGGIVGDQLLKGLIYSDDRGPGEEVKGYEYVPNWQQADYVYQNQQNIPEEDKELAGAAQDLEGGPGGIAAEAQQILKEGFNISARKAIEEVGQNIGGMGGVLAAGSKGMAAGSILGESIAKLVYLSQGKDLTTSDYLDEVKAAVQSGIQLRMGTFKTPTLLNYINQQLSSTRAIKPTPTTMEDILTQNEMFGDDLALQTATKQDINAFLQNRGITMEQLKANQLTYDTASAAEKAKLEGTVYKPGWQQTQAEAEEQAKQGAAEEEENQVFDDALEDFGEDVFDDALEEAPEIAAGAL